MSTIVKLVVSGIVIGLAMFFAWELLQQNRAVSALIVEAFSENDLDVQALMAWYVLSAMAAPLLGLICIILALKVWFGGVPSDPGELRRYAGELLREADAVEQYRAEQQQERLRVPRVDVRARRARP